MHTFMRRYQSRGIISTGTYPGRKVRMTEITAPKSPVTAEQFADEIREQLKYTQNVTAEQATAADVYVAVSKAVRNHLADSWFKTQADTVNGNTKAVGYLSAEFLMGKQLENALLNAGLTDQFDKAVEALGFKPKDIVDAEARHRALATVAFVWPPASSDSLRLPRCARPSVTASSTSTASSSRDSTRTAKQVETRITGWPTREPWGHTDYNRDQKVSFGGKVVEHADGTKSSWEPAWSVRAVPVDYMVPGYKSQRVNTLRLWTAKSYDEFDLLAFNRSEYMDAVAPQVKAENISKILYPEDSTKVGKELRLEQQYFFVSASLHDAIRVFYPGQDKPDLTTFPDKIVFQLNDTHPVIGIPELMRILIDEYGYDWDTAWSVTTKTFNYTCHTLLPEALEVWPASLIGELLPRHLEIIEKINAQFEAELKAKGVAADTIKDMAIYTGDAVRMAYLATYGGSHVNGVAELHSQLLKDVTLKNFSDVYPDKFTNVTNGVTPRRFVKLANPRLSDLITEGLGTDKWVADLELLKGLEPLAKDDEFVKKFAAVKKANKHAFVGFAKDHYGIDIDENTLFNTMVKRLHEYKRQSLKILAVISTYADIKSGKVKAEDITPRTVFFGAKAAPGYYLAKMTIELINNVSRVISSDSAVKGKLAVHMLPNYNVEMAQNLIPATELDEQISQAGKEASGTGNMKFALNGALTVGTLDGANVEIRERVGADNFFLFGMTVDEVEAQYANGYDPAKYYEADPRLKQAIDLVADGTFSNGDRNAYSPLVADWLTKDWFMTLADFSAYMGIQSEIEALYADELEWNRKAVLNVANSGYFSSDRSMEDYLERIWHTAPLA